MSVWEQRQYADPLGGRPASQGCKRQPSVAVRSIWEDLYYSEHNKENLERYEQTKMEGGIERHLPKQSNSVIGSAGCRFISMS